VVKELGLGPLIYAQLEPARKTTDHLDRNQREGDDESTDKGSGRKGTVGTEAEGIERTEKKGAADGMERADGMGDVEEVHDVHCIWALRLLSEMLEPTWIGAVGQSIVQGKIYEAVRRALDARSIPYLPLKGIDLSARVYEVRESRTMSDIDILVPAEKQKLAAEVLAELPRVKREPWITGPGAWEESSPHVVLTFEIGSSSVCVEVHRDIGRKHQIYVDLEGVWRRAVPDEGMGVHLDAADNLMFTAFHLSRSLFELRPVWLVDLLGICMELKPHWIDVVERAKKWHCSTAVWFALDRAQVTLSEQFAPQWVCDELAPGTFRRGYLDSVVPPFLVGSPIVRESRRQVQARVLLPLMDDWRQAARFLARYAGVRLADTAARSGGTE
jgi:hypothetical protein